jgi:pimeloyl-ACP methyl ester carboxylesterase
LKNKLENTCLFAIIFLCFSLNFTQKSVADENISVISREQIAAKYTDRDSKFATLDNISVHYKDQGNGPAILLVHGSGGDLGDWDGWVKVLSPHYRVLRLDLPGAGLSGTIPNGNYSIDRVLSLVDALMDGLGIERFAIAGNSYGGIVAFRYAATRVERVTGLILMNSAGIEYGMKRGTSSSTAPNPILTATAITRDGIAAGLTMTINDPARITDGLIQRRLDFANVTGRDQERLAIVHLYERGDPFRVLAHIRAPTLVEWGGANKGLSLETADSFVIAVKNACIAKKIVYEGGGHTMNIERPEATASDAMAFLDRYVAPLDKNPADRSRCEH